MIGKAATSLARPAVRSSRALNGSLPTQRLFHQTSFQAMKLMQSKKTKQPTSAKELYQQSVKVNTAFAARIKNALAVPRSGPTPLQSGMPQLVPFFFVNEVVFGFTGIAILVYFFSKYFLPRFVRMFMARMFISKL